MNGGTIRRIRSTASGGAPTAVISANPTSGQAPLTVQFDGTSSSDPENGTLTYAWDLDGDGALDDSTAANPSFTYATAGTRTVRLQVTDPQQLTGSTTRLIDVTGTGGGQTYAQVIGSMSPVAYWRLGETSGTSAADSAGSTTGTYAGGFTLGVAGLLTGDTNRAVQLNGTTGQVTVPNAAALNPTTAISIAGWLNATSFTNRNPRIFQKGINDTQYRLLVEGGQLVFHIAGVGTVTGPLPSLNTRHFVVGTYDRTTMRLYLDGTQVGQTAATAAIPVTSEPAAIGNKPTSTDARDPFPGVLDDVSIHNVALSAAQVGQLWTTGHDRLGGGGTNTPPVPVIDTPAASVTWKVGDTISFTGHATDAEDGTLAASRLSWSLILEHCPSNCHTHSIQSWSGVASGSFQAPDHDYPSDLLLTLTATDSAGTPVSTSVKLDPKTVVLSFASSPTGLQLTHNGSTATAPFTRTVIQGSANSISAAASQTLGGQSYTFQSWSDAGARAHTVTADSSMTLTATYTASERWRRDGVSRRGARGRPGQLTGAWARRAGRRPPTRPAATHGTYAGGVTLGVVRRARGRDGHGGHPRRHD